MQSHDAGHYCCRVGEQELAIEHFKSAGRSADGQETMKLLAAAEAVASLLDQGGPASIPKAQDIVREFSVEVLDGQDLLCR